MKTFQLLTLTLCLILTLAGKNKNKKSKNSKSKGDMNTYSSTTTTSTMNTETSTTDMSNTDTSMTGSTGTTDYDDSKDPCKGRKRRKKKGNGRGRKNKYDSDSSNSGWDNGKGKGKGKKKGKKYDCDDEDRSSSGWWAYSTTDDYDMTTTDEFDMTTTEDFNVTDMFPNMTEVSGMITTDDTDTTSTTTTNGTITGPTESLNCSEPLDVDIDSCFCFNVTNCPSPRCQFLAQCLPVTITGLSDGSGSGAQMQGEDSGGLAKGVNMSSNTTLWMIGVGSAVVVTVLLCMVFGVICYMRKGNTYDNVAVMDSEYGEGVEMNGRATPMGQTDMVKNVVIEYGCSEDENELIMDGDGCAR